MAAPRHERASTLGVVLAALLLAVLVVVGGPVGTTAAGASQVPVTTPAGVAVGGFHSCALLDGGVVRCWGYNLVGQLGLGTTTNLGTSGPVDAQPAVDLGGPAVALATGTYHSCAVLLGGAVRCWGYGVSGQLGLGSTAGVGDDEVPAARARVDLGGSAVAVAVGGAHSCAALAGGAVRCWGADASGQLGLGSSRVVGDDEVPTAVGPVDLAGPAVGLAAGGDHTCALLDGGAVRCWGAGASGQLGTGSTAAVGDDEPASAAPTVDLGPGRVAVALAAGRAHTCALLDTGQVRCWGANDAGQLGTGTTAAVGDDEPVAAGSPVDLGGLGAVAVTAGGDASCAVLAGGSLRCWGANDRGQLGLGTTARLGDDEAVASVPPIDLGPGAVVTAASTGGTATCAALLDGSVRCWGDNQVGQLGAGDGTTRGDDEAVTTAPAVATGGVGAHAVVQPASASAFVGLVPARLLDTRDGGGAKLGADGRVDLVVAGRGGVPDRGVVAVAVTLTATDPDAAGYVTAWPSGQPRPLASNLNVERPGQTIATLATVPVGPDGVVSIYTQSPTHLVVDVAGYYRAAPVASAGRLQPLVPGRLLDTRTTAKPADDSTTDVDVLGRGGVPTSGVSSVVLTLTATEAAGLGYLTAWPSGHDRPLASSLNVAGSGTTIAGQVVVPVGAGGRVSVYAQRSTHLVVDVVGWFTDASAPVGTSGLFVPSVPVRQLDTRSGDAVGAGGSVVFAPPAALPGARPAAGVAATLTATEAAAPGYVTAYPDGTEPPLASSTNLDHAGQTVANHLTAAVGGGGGVRLLVQSGVDLVVDVTGTYQA